jgi:hypothetical protein
MYPPLDATSNSAGGKGPAGIQWELVDRKWEGSDIPKSILEAGELFSERVRMTRAVRQLWEERERFLKFERGWQAPEDDSEIDGLDLDELSLSEREEIAAVRRGGRTAPSSVASDIGIDLGPDSNISPDVQRRLVSVENFYVRTSCTTVRDSQLRKARSGRRCLTYSL